jgi:hypothetical protein
LLKENRLKWGSLKKIDERPFSQSGESDPPERTFSGWEKLSAAK